LPPTVARAVTELRKPYDPRQASLPPEITVSGSSGLGVLAANQSMERVLDAVARIAKTHLPFSTSFVSMEQFPGVPIFWLKPRDRRPFDAIQRALIAEGVLFESSPFPFHPHCTISMATDLCEAQERELLNTAIPGEEFVLDYLAVYQLAEDHVVPLFRTSVKQPSPNPSFTDR
jgi:2'-5' RNA ligase